jgi:hypothetical protein
MPRWQGTEYRAETKDDGSWRVERREKGGEWKPVPGAKGKATSKAEAKYLAEHRREIVREGDHLGSKASERREP